MKETNQEKKRPVLLYGLLTIMSICLLYTFISLFVYQENGAYVNDYHGYASAKVKDPLGIYSQVYRGPVDMSKYVLEQSALKQYKSTVGTFLVIFIIAEGGVITAILLNNKKKNKNILE